MYVVEDTKVGAFQRLCVMRSVSVLRRFSKTLEKKND